MGAATVPPARPRALPGAAALAAAALALLSSGAARAQQFTLCVDVPSALGGVTLLPDQLASRASGSYSAGTALPGATLRDHVSAVAEVSPGAFYLCLDAPFSLSGTTVQPSDILLLSGGTLSLFRAGASLGIPAGAAVDALALTPGGGILLSFDAPTSVASTTYLPSDLALVSGSGLVPYLSGASVGLRPEANLVGAEVLPDGKVLLAVDIPAELAGTRFLPGDLLLYDPAGFGSVSPTPFFRDPDFPPGAVLTDFALPGGAGTVPDGSAATTPLRLAKSATPGSLDLSWGPSCTPEVSGYGIYQGTLGSWYDHAALTCLPGTGTTATVVPGAGNTYYLVVPNNEDFEGGYGRDSSGGAIPPSGSACRSWTDARPCP